MTHMCDAETRQPVAATVDEFCLGRLIATHAAGTSHTKQVNANREFRLTCSCLAFGARMSVILARTHMVAQTPLTGFCNTHVPGRFAKACGVVSEFLYCDDTHVLQKPVSMGQQQLKCFELGILSIGPDAVENPETGLTPSCLAFATHMCVRVRQCTASRALRPH